MALTAAFNATTYTQKNGLLGSSHNAELDWITHKVRRNIGSATSSARTENGHWNGKLAKERY